MTPKPDTQTRSGASSSMPDQAIIQSALIKGFAVSSNHGQEAGKLMPVSDHKTLISFARDIERMTRTATIEAERIAAKEASVELTFLRAHFSKTEAAHKAREEELMACIARAALCILTDPENCITDTIWIGPAETLYDHLRAALPIENWADDVEGQEKQLDALIKQARKTKEE